MNGYTTLAGNGRYEYEDRKSVFIGLCGASVRGRCGRRRYVWR